MSVINAILGPLVNAALMPFRGFDPMVGLTVVSLVTAILMLLVYKRTSNQVALADVKRGVQAALFEIRLFSDDLINVFRAQGDLLRHNLSYLKLSLVPMVWMIVPIALLIAQLQFHYGYEGLHRGGSTLVKVVLEPEFVSLDGSRPAVSMSAPAGVRVESPGVWIPSTHEVVWRVRAEEPGEYVLTVMVDGKPITKTLTVADNVVKRSPERLAPGFLNQFLYPAESPIDVDGVEAVTVGYTERAVGVAGFETHWLVVFFILSIVLAFALKGRFGVVM
jgi:uncharacterized membrane protein (DUF106 family)